LGPLFAVKSKQSRFLRFVFYLLKQPLFIF